MKVIIAGGGTGGHVFPGIAIADEIRRRDPSAEVVFVGTEHGIEATVVPREGYTIRFLRAEGFVGKSLLRKARGVFKAGVALVESYRLLREIRPDVVIGVGGYASVGPVLAAYLRSVPTVIAEQNSVPGLANRLLGGFADAVCITYHESLSLFPRSRTFVTGNPVREGIVSGSRETAYRLFGLERGKFTIFVFGGSSGARKINTALCASFSHLSDLRGEIQFLHQTGRTDYNSVREAYRKWDFRGTVAPFVHQMAEAYAVADLVVSRAGATTLAEITAVGRPAILIPYPFAAGHHQEVNAERLAEMGAARIILDYELDGEVLGRHIRDLYSAPGMRAEMQRASRSLGRPDAAEKVVDILMSVKKMAAISRRQKGGQPTDRQESGGRPLSRGIETGEGTQRV